MIALAAFCCAIICGICPGNICALSVAGPSAGPGIQSAVLYMDVLGPTSGANAILLNGTEIGKVPVAGETWLRSAGIPIPEGALGSIATINEFLVDNDSRELFRIRNIRLEVRGIGIGIVRSSLLAGLISSYETANFGAGWLYSGNRYLARPFSFSLTLPADRLGYIKQPLFHYKNTVSTRPGKGEEYWKRVEKAALKNTRQRTMLLTRPHVVAALPVEFILAQLERYNSGRIELSGFHDLPEQMRRLRKEGYIIGVMGGAGSSKSRIPGSKENEAFLERVKKAAGNVDILKYFSLLATFLQALQSGGGFWIIEHTIFFIFFIVFEKLNSQFYMS